MDLIDPLITFAVAQGAAGISGARNVLTLPPPRVGWAPGRGVGRRIMTCKVVVLLICFTWHGPVFPCVMRCETEFGAASAYLHTSATHDVTTRTFTGTDANTRSDPSETGLSVCVGRNSASSVQTAKDSVSSFLNHLPRNKNPTPNIPPLSYENSKCNTTGNAVLRMSVYLLRFTVVRNTHLLLTLVHYSILLT